MGTTMMRVREWMIGLGIIGAMVGAVVLAGSVAPGNREYISENNPRGRVTQQEFLRVCAEDEALMFIAGEFKYAVCVNREDVPTYNIYKEGMKGD